MARKLTSSSEMPVRTFPVLPIRRSLVLPYLRVPLLLTRPVTIQAAEQAMMEPDRLLAVFAQTNKSETLDSAEDFSKTGVLVQIRDFTSLPNGFVKLMVEGVDTVTAISFASGKDAVWLTHCSPLRRVELSVAETEKALARLKAKLQTLAESLDTMPEELRTTLQAVPVIREFCYRLFPLLEPSLDTVTTFLENKKESDLVEMMEALLDNAVRTKESIVRAERKATRAMEKSHRDWQLQQRIKSLQEELDNPLEVEKDPEIRRFEQRLREATLPAAVQEKAEAELARLVSMRDSGPEAAVLRNYLDWILSMPWGVRVPEKFDLKHIRKTLDQDHTGLEKVKERILEHAAVLSLVEDRAYSPVLCLVGPPGVGKTSLVRSIADALQRPLVRITLGGVRDESEIRGHRRTYVGSLPGRIVQALRKAKVMNPVILLDEIDKMSSDFRGDPASALLEVLDPEQNKEFQDHFLEVGVNLGEVLFIATANGEDHIPHALHDRFEMVRLTGYHRHEKHAIVRNHLLPKVSKRNGLKQEQVELSDEALDRVLDGYTREAGVRELERQMDRICRKRALEIQSSKKAVASVEEKDVAKYLGVALYQNQSLPKATPGIIMGLAYTQTGGEILPIECVLLSGRGRLQLTGKLGEVMKESAQIALTLVRQRALRFGVDPDIFRKTDIHIHVPEGAIPKDGPSAGIALTLALLSAFTRQSVPSTVAFTGEVSLTGQVHAIGGLTEKSLAALRNGVTHLHVPKGNLRHIDELPQPVRKGLHIQTHDEIDSIISVLFQRPSKTKKGAEK